MDITPQMLENCDKNTIAIENIVLRNDARFVTWFITFVKTVASKADENTRNHI